MKMELRIEGKVIVIEAEGMVSVQIRDENSPSVASAVAPVVALENVPQETQKIVPVANVQENAPQDFANADGLFAKLVELRRELATAAGVPPYVVFKDATLREMVEKLPQDLAAFANIGGVGKAKFEKYGEIFLSAIKGAAA